MKSEPLWLLQSNLVDAMTAKVAWALRSAGRGFAAFELKPGAPAPEPPADPARAAFPYGSTGMLSRLRAEPGWAGRIFGSAEGLDQRTWIAERGEDMLNAEVEFLTLGELRAAPPKRPFFARPAIDHKAFDGHAAAEGDLSGIFRGKKGLRREQTDDLLVAVSPVAPRILSEWRAIVLDGELRLASRYRDLGRMAPSAGIDPDVLAKCEGLAAGWQPARLSVMDVAIVEGGRAKIVEFNSVHSSGLYAIDPSRFVELVDEALAMAPEPARAARPRRAA